MFAAIDPNGALSRLIGEYPDLQWQVLASVGSAGGEVGGLNGRSVDRV